MVLLDDCKHFTCLFIPNLLMVSVMVLFANFKHFTCFFNQPSVTFLLFPFRFFSTYKRYILLIFLFLLVTKNLSKLNNPLLLCPVLSLISNLNCPFMNLRLNFGLVCLNFYFHYSRIFFPFTLYFIFVSTIVVFKYY